VLVLFGDCIDLYFVYLSFLMIAFYVHKLAVGDFTLQMIDTKYVT